ncbi:MAG: spore coat protein CotJB [Eubacteriales bacterium]|nr:spore coat protein CotJB [Eubacteriales bacterium]MDD4422773.1 spore coat protein CotJB [Eubacteriales bacterium]HBR31995.1 spore coat protein CotJB [Clostridiales bacterium]
MNNERAQALKKLQIISFAVNEAALYLDGHPTNKMALAFYEKAVKEHKDLLAKYEKTYGPITFFSASGPSWTWVQGPWPWQNEREA